MGCIKHGWEGIGLEEKEPQVFYRNLVIKKRQWLCMAATRLGSALVCALCPSESSIFMHTNIQNSLGWGYVDAKRQQKQWVSLHLTFVLPFPKLNEASLFRDPGCAALIQMNSDSTQCILTEAVIACDRLASYRKCSFKVRWGLP